MKRVSPLTGTPYWPNRQARPRIADIRRLAAGAVDVILRLSQKLRIA